MKENPRKERPDDYQVRLQALTAFLKASLITTAPEILSLSSCKCWLRSATPCPHPHPNYCSCAMSYSHTPLSETLLFEPIHVPHCTKQSTVQIRPSVTSVTGLVHAQQFIRFTGG